MATLSEEDSEMRPSSIVIHHSLTKDGKTVSWDDIRRYHKGLGWRDIGYHFGVELVDNEYEVMVGRMLNESGAHCKQEEMNYKSIGICCVGNFDDYAPPQAQWELTLRLVRSLMEVFYINRENVFGHNQFASYKTCPGKSFNMDTFRKGL